MIPAHFDTASGVCVAWSAVAAQSLVGTLRDVWAAHDDFDPGGAQGVGDQVRTGDHSSHRPDADEIYILVTAKAHKLGPSHRLCVAIDENDLMPLRRQGLEQKHPQVRHEIARHAIVRIVEKDLHRAAVIFKNGVQLPD